MARVQRPGARGSGGSVQSLAGTSQVSRHLQLQSRRVLRDSSGGIAAAGVRRRGAAGLWRGRHVSGRADRRDRGSRARARRRAIPDPANARLPGSCDAGDRADRVRRAHRRRAANGRRAVSVEHLPGAHAARDRSGAPVPPRSQQDAQYRPPDRSPERRDAPPSLRRGSGPGGARSSGRGLPGARPGSFHPARGHRRQPSRGTVQGNARRAARRVSDHPEHRSDARGGGRPGPAGDDRRKSAATYPQRSRASRGHRRCRRRLHRDADR